MTTMMIMQDLFVSMLVTKLLIQNTKLGLSIHLLWPGVIPAPVIFQTMHDELTVVPRQLTQIANQTNEVSKKPSQKESKPLTLLDLLTSSSSQPETSSSPRRSIPPARPTPARPSPRN